MSKIPIAIQLYSVRGECTNDLATAVKGVADLGYVGAEPYGFGGDSLEWMGCGCKDIRKMFDDNGLACCGIHLRPTAVVGDNLKRTIEFNQVMGNRFLIVAANKAKMEASDTIKEFADELNTVADLLKPEGMFAGYHAHGFDFAEVDGEPAWNILFANLRPDVIMQMDVGNCMSGGGDPVATLQKFPGRARSVHLKDFGAPEGGVIGEGTADWENVFDLCENLHKTEWYVVEEGGKDGIGFDVCARSLAALRAMGK